jgi:hypothetical protein
MGCYHSPDIQVPNRAADSYPLLISFCLSLHPADPADIPFWSAHAPASLLIPQDIGENNCLGLAPGKPEFDKENTTEKSGYRV